jgi:hypothetical protein
MESNTRVPDSELLGGQLLIVFFLIILIFFVIIDLIEQYINETKRKRR